jgi:putative intracellular protease/amidase
MGRLSTPKLAASVENTKPVGSLSVVGFDALVVAGGHAPMFVFDKAEHLRRKFLKFYEAGKVTAAFSASDSSR